MPDRRSTPNPIRRSVAPIPEAHATALQRLLADRLGLDVATVAPSFLGDVAQRALDATGARDLQGLLQDAESGGSAWQMLVDQAVVAETWFFRDQGPFEHIVSIVRERWAGGLTTRILSCPCSTGEEPYSVAMALQDAGLPPEAAWIDAIDISMTALAAARAGVYRARSFRGVDPSRRDRHFEREPGGRTWRLTPELRGRVQFAGANLVTGDGLAERERYDIVLCRNLLIYMHEEARVRAFATFRRLLAGRGVLVVGHAEPGIAREHGFVGTGEPGAFAFVAGGEGQKAAARGVAPVAAQPRAPSVAGRFNHSGARSGQAPAGREESAGIQDLPAPSSAASRPDDSVERATLDRIRRMGDEGRLGDAVNACRHYLAAAPGSADGHFLLGVLLGANGETTAAESALRRALYLRPDHADALMHLALVEESRGAVESAARLRARAVGLSRAASERVR